MKKKFVLSFVIALLLISLIPVSAFAAAPADLKVFVRNTTGAEVDLRLTDANGDYIWLTIPAGVSEVELMEGKYEYYAVTNCGTQFGQWNLNVSKQLDIHCKDGELEFNLAKRCSNGWWGTYYSLYAPDGGYLFTVYIERDSVNAHDWLLDDGMPSEIQVRRGETTCWSDALVRFGFYPEKRDIGVWFFGGGS